MYLSDLGKERTLISTSEEDVSFIKEEYGYLRETAFYKETIHSQLTYIILVQVQGKDCGVYISDQGRILRRNILMAL